MASRVLHRFWLGGEALCNDGSRAAYYYDAATRVDQSNIWIVHQQGGGWCWDSEGCQERLQTQPWFTSSHGWPSTYSALSGSILNAVNTRFSAAHVVYLRYCTSDAYIGNGTSADGVLFRGRAVVAATFAALHARHGLGSPAGGQSEPRVLYSGCSAGGRGVMHNLNYVSRQLHHLTSGRSVVYGLIDSGLYMDLPDLTPGGTPFAERAQKIVSYVHAAVDPSCVRKLGEAWRCLMGEYAIGDGTLGPRHLVHSFQFDSFQLDEDLPVSPLTREVLQQHPGFSLFVDVFRVRTRRVLLDKVSALPNAGVFSSACYHHCNTEGEGFSGTYGTVGGASLAAVVDSAFFGSAGPTFLVENCSGFNCGRCARAPQPAAVLGAAVLSAAQRASSAALDSLAIPAAGAGDVLPLALQQRQQRHQLRRLQLVRDGEGEASPVYCESVGCGPAPPRPSHAHWPLWPLSLASTAVFWLLYAVALPRVGRCCAAHAALDSLNERCWRQNVCSALHTALIVVTSTFLLATDWRSMRDAGVGMAHSRLLYMECCVSLGYFAFALPTSLHMVFVLNAGLPYASPLICVHHAIAVVALATYLGAQHGGFYVAASALLFETTNVFFIAHVLMLQHRVAGVVAASNSALFFVAYVLCRMVGVPLLVFDSLAQLAATRTDAHAHARSWLAVGVSLGCFYALALLSWLWFFRDVVPAAREAMAAASIGDPDSASCSVCSSILGSAACVPARCRLFFWRRCTAEGRAHVKLLRMRQRALRELREEQSLALAAAAGETAKIKGGTAHADADGPATSACSFFAKSTVQSA